MSDPETLKEKMKKLSWKSELFLTCPDTGNCPFSNDTKPHQHAFTTRIVPPSDDPRTLLTPIKGVLFWNLEPVPFDPSLDAEPECCFNCGKKRHEYKDCRKPKIMYCCNCGRRGVQVADCPRCFKAYQQFVKRGRQVRALPPRSTDMPSRARSLGRVESNGYRDKSRGRASNFEGIDSRSARDKSRGRARNAETVDSGNARDKNQGRTSNFETFDWMNARDRTRGRARNVESFEAKKAADKSRERSKSVSWFDSQDSRETAGLKNTESRGRDERKAVNVWDDSPAYNEMQSDNKMLGGNLASGSASDSTRNVIEVMAAVKHLPAETQNAVALHFLEEQRRILAKQNGLNTE